MAATDRIPAYVEVEVGGHDGSRKSYWAYLRDSEHVQLISRAVNPYDLLRIVTTCVRVYPDHIDAIEDAFEAMFEGAGRGCLLKVIPGDPGSARIMLACDEAAALAIGRCIRTSDHNSRVRSWGYAPEAEEFWKIVDQRPALEPAPEPTPEPTPASAPATAPKSETPPEPALEPAPESAPVSETPPEPASEPETKAEPLAPPASPRASEAVAAPATGSVARLRQLIVGPYGHVGPTIRLDSICVTATATTGNASTTGNARTTGYASTTGAARTTGDVGTAGIAIAGYGHAKHMNVANAAAAIVTPGGYATKPTCSEAGINAICEAIVESTTAAAPAPAVVPKVDTITLESLLQAHNATLAHRRKGARCGLLRLRELPTTPAVWDGGVPTIALRGGNSYWLAKDGDRSALLPTTAKAVRDLVPTFFGGLFRKVTDSKKNHNHWRSFEPYGLLFGRAFGEAIVESLSSGPGLKLMGSAIARVLVTDGDHRSPEFDLCVVGLTLDEAKDQIAKLFGRLWDLVTNGPQPKPDYGCPSDCWTSIVRQTAKVIRVADAIAFRVESDSHNELPEICVRVSLRQFGHLSEAIHDCDTAPFSVAFDGTELWFSEAAALAWRSGVYLLDVESGRADLEKRIVACARSGFLLALPNLAVAEIRNRAREKGETEIRLGGMTIGFSPDSMYALKNVLAIKSWNANKGSCAWPVNLRDVGVHNVNLAFRGETSAFIIDGGRSTWGEEPFIDYGTLNRRGAYHASEEAVLGLVTIQSLYEYYSPHVFAKVLDLHKTPTKNARQKIQDKAKSRHAEITAVLSEFRSPVRWAPETRLAAIPLREWYGKYYAE